MFSRATLDALGRRADWFLTGLTSKKLVNGFASAMAYVIRASWSSPWPTALKIDLSPACNLKCSSCIHAEPGNDELLREQRFSNKQMTVRQFRSIVDEVKGHVSALSLYYLGDPFAHPHIDEMCWIASEAGINVHLSTNFSFHFSDARIRSILESGVSHLTVCVDGFSQATYERTRKSGRLPWVLSNLERVSRARKALGRDSLKIEVQYLKYQHNVHELAVARSWFERVGVDSVVDEWGMVSNCVEIDPSRYIVLAAKKAKILPLCLWPYNSFVIRYDGEVLPCCNYRLATQYVEPTTTWGYGNVFASSVREVWQSISYRRLRRLVCTPELEASKDDFCFGCSNLFETNGMMTRKAGPEYELDTSGPAMT
jgi:MoaA/NifB/PqqE/SkfB family radical SAM enzyme